MINANSFFLAISVFLGCVNLEKKPIKNQLLFKEVSYESILKKYKSCTGKGEVYSKNIFPGVLKFEFVSQNDSSFLEFRDIIGRRVLLVLIDQEYVSAWNVLENKRYSKSQILNLYPPLYLVELIEITKFLWGFKPDLFSEVQNNSIEYLPKVIINYEKDSLDQIRPFSVEAKFENETITQSIKIKIKNRVFNPSKIDVNKVWSIVNI